MTELKTIRELGIESISIHSKDRKTLKNYVNIPEYKMMTINGQREYVLQPSIKEKKKCLIAYCKNCLGVVFMIKTKVKCRSYVHLHKSYYGLNTFCITEKEAVTLINNNQSEAEILSEDDLTKIQNLEVVKTLKESE